MSNLRSQVESARGAQLEAAQRRLNDARHDRLSPTKDTADALNELHDRMVFSALHFEDGALENKREGIAYAMASLRDFLRSQGFGIQTIVTILRTQDALTERARNSPDPLFAQRKRAGRPLVSLRALERAGVLAALADAWLVAYDDGERTHKRLLADAARAFKGDWFRSVSRAQLSSARDLVSQHPENHRSVATAAVVSGMLEEAAKKHGMKAAIKSMIIHLNNSPRGYAIGRIDSEETPPVSSEQAD